MTRVLLGLAVLGLLVAASPADGACRWFGTQLVCDVGGHPVRIGTQVAPRPEYAGRISLPQRLSGDGDLGLAPAPAAGMRLELQNFGTDAAACRMIGNERYCY